jgi:tetratricopeptide (TPR) repeat protein
MQVAYFSRYFVVHFIARVRRGSGRPGRSGCRALRRVCHEAASEQLADAKLRAQWKEIEQLRLKVSTSAAETANLRSELALAEEKYVAELAERDRAYGEEIAVFRASVQDIASTPEAAAALERFNAGDEVGALAILDDLTKARDKARQKREQIEAAADRRRTATLALDARAKGKVTTEQAIARFVDVTKLDSGVYWDWVELVRLYQSAGRLSEARIVAQHAADTARSERDQGVALSELGDVQAKQGDIISALASYRKALGIAEALVGRYPNNALWRSDLAVSYQNVGNVQAKQGDLAAALASYRKELAIAEMLAGRDPGNTDWQRVLSKSYNKVGDIELQQGDRDAALASYRKYLTIAESLADRDPGNTDWQSDLSISYERIGEVQAKQGDLVAALASYKKYRAIAETLAGRDSGNADWQLDVAISNKKVGDLQAEQGDLNAAPASYRRYLAIMETLAGRDPSNVECQSPHPAVGSGKERSIDRLSDGNEPLSQLQLREHSLDRTAKANRNSRCWSLCVESVWTQGEAGRESHPDSCSDDRREAPEGHGQRTGN